MSDLSLYIREQKPVILVHEDDDLLSRLVRICFSMINVDCDIAVDYAAANSLLTRRKQKNSRYWGIFTDRSTPGSPHPGLQSGEVIIAQALNGLGYESGHIVLFSAGEAPQIVHERRIAFFKKPSSMDLKRLHNPVSLNQEESSMNPYMNMRYALEQQGFVM